MRGLKIVFCALSLGLIAAANLPAQPPAQADQLVFVAIVARHGVRSPTGKTAQLNQYARQPWPQWSVPPGNLTAHGVQLMKLFGAYDRELLASQGLLADGCDAARHIAIVADSDQRTRETGRALAAGLAPDCPLTVRALAEGTPDPLFHSLESGVGNPDKPTALAAVAGRIGNDPSALADAYLPQLEELEAVLGGCAPVSPCPAPAPASIFTVPATLAPGKSDHLVDLRSPLSVASTMAEDLLLEYTEGMDASSVGWGRLDLATLRDLIQLHTAEEDIAQRTPYVARVQASNLLSHLLASMRQATTAQPVAGALTGPGDRLLILVGHDTNLANISGALGLNWLIDGRRDDTPPGGALVFELWKSPGPAPYSVRTWYTAQTLDQMRTASPLSLKSPPPRVPVFLPACGRADGSCPWDAFQQAVSAAIDPAFVK